MLALGKHKKKVVSGGGAITVGELSPTSTVDGTGTVVVVVA